MAGQIPIEQRDGREISMVGEQRAGGRGGYNPAFDVTSAELVTAIVSDAGVLRPPFEASIARALGTAAAA